MKLRKGKPEEVGMSAKRINHVSDLARGWVEDGTIPSLVVLAARRGTNVLHEAFGMQGPETESPALSRDAVFSLASITKVFTATAAMILVEKGLLSLNRPLQEYIPEFIGEKKDQVMIHHLLTHTSGMNDQDMEKHITQELGLKEPPILTDDGIIFHYKHRGLIYSAPLSLDPGAEMSYCDTGFLLLGEVVTKVSGKPLQEFMQETIFQPLGMNNTFMLPTTSQEKLIVRHPKGAPWHTPEQGFRKIPHGAASVYSSASDLATFGQMFLNDGIYDGRRILSPQSVREMTRNQIPGVVAKYGIEMFPEAGWGLGWAIQENKKNIRYGSLLSQYSFWHSGAGGVNMWVDPVNEIVGVYLSVELESRDDGGHKWNLDHFANAVTAAVVD